VSPRHLPGAGRRQSSSRTAQARTVGVVERTDAEPRRHSPAGDLDLDSAARKRRIHHGRLFFERCQPDGGAEMSPSPKERVYYVVKGSITVNGKDGETHLLDPGDLIYIAPPQYQGLWSKTLLALEANPGWLDRDGLAVVQIFPKELEPLPLTSLQLTSQRKYGSTLLCFYQPVAAQEP